GVVVTDSGGRILLVNRAFLGLAQVSAEGAAKGRALSEWFGGDAGPLRSILAHARKHGLSAQTEATMLGAQGGTAAVDVTAVLLPEGDQECIGFTIALVQSRAQAQASGGVAMSAALEHLTSQLGIVALPSLIEEAARTAERHFIVAALGRTGGDRN